MKSRREIGSITIEATISLAVFIFAFLGITSLTRMIRAEEKIQYALNQSAKELSQYTYIFYRAGLHSQEGADTKSSDELISETSQFCEMVKSKSLEYKNKKFDTGNIVNDFQTAINGGKNDLTEIINQGKKLSNLYSNTLDDPTAVLSGIYSVVKDEAANSVRSMVVAPVVGNLLMPKYIAGSRAEADKYLEGIGVEGGMSGLNWQLSQILDDGRTINLTVVYKIKYKIPLIGDYDYTVKQTASTAAWKADKKIKDVVKTTIWDKAPTKRGKDIVESVKKKNDALAVDGKKTKGFDLYDKKTNTFTNVISINTGDASYLSKDSNGNTVLNEANFKSKIRSAGNSLKKYMGSTDKVYMSDGTSINVSGNKKGEIKIYIPKNSPMYGDASKYAEELSNEFKDKNITFKVVEYSE